MYVKVVKKLDLRTIGNVAFRFNDRKSKLRTNIWITELDIDHDNAMELSLDDAHSLFSIMRKNKSDLFTDGKRFYTIKDLNMLVEIKHKSFEDFLEQEDEVA